MAFNQKKYNQSIRGIAVTACKASKRRAKIKNLPFNLTSNYLESIYPKNSVCPILGYTMKVSNISLGKLSPTLDRIDPRLGYVKGNVEFVTNIANLMMTSATGRDIKRFVKWATKRYNITREEIYG
ncbi:MAG: hypothetical protein CBC24_02665 [Candidatus Pelagibacter sp. TMED64]|nr:hypothetical protein [Candidatus Pelagibacter sp.]OUU66639.1 MAG: hypothetical protein CBC24_02665 [Candidatus Pelagibacter sp. TMED64]|tara:strand:+ start:4647 stop:5024 length:378 start_codon:yes stop_codon:yes gene_type:complete